MRQHTSLFPVASATAVAFVTTAFIFIAPDFAKAAEPKSNSIPQAGGGNSCGCPDAKEKMWSRPKFAEMPATAQPVMLDESDEIAALESVQFALSEVGDGASYIWHRNNGRLSGMVKPLGSFKDRQGQICRHVVVILTAGSNSKKAEGVACRATSGQWKLEG
jgi:hypothetical protein